MFAICRTQKLKTAGNSGGLNSHLTRTMEVPNADKELQKFNYRIVGSDNLTSDIQKRITAAGIDPRKNAVLAVEHLLTASPEFFDYKKGVNEKGEVELRGNVDNRKAFTEKSKEWLEERYGKDNVVNITVHLDEKTPHLHAVVVPIDAKGKLNAREFLGGREKMRDMQNSFADKMKPIGLSRGIEGSKAKHMAIKEFYGLIGSDQPQIEAVKAVLDKRENLKVSELMNLQQRQAIEIKQATDKLKKAEDDLREAKRKLELRESQVKFLKKEITYEQTNLEMKKIEEKYNPKLDNGQSRGHSMGI